MREIIFLNEFLGNFREFYAHMLRSIHWVLEIKVFYVKADKARIFLRQDTVNNDLDEVEVTFGCAYIAWVVDGDTRDSDTCTIGILLLRSDLTHNHGVAIFFLLLQEISSEQMIRKAFVPSTCCFLGPFDLFRNTCHIRSISLA